MAPRALRRAPWVAVPLALLWGAAAQGDQLQWLEHEAGGRAYLALQPGDLFVEWISHNGIDEDKGRPILYRARTVHLRDEGDHVEVEVLAEAVAFAEGARAYDGWRFRALEAPEPPEEMALDLAYTYVISNEVPGMFVNLGKRLGLACTVKHIALEVPPDVLAAALARR
jgi:hypothetical protein